MKWFHCDKHRTNDDFIQLETANESGNEKVSSRVEAFMEFEKQHRWFKV